ETRFHELGNLHPADEEPVAGIVLEQAGAKWLIGLGVTTEGHRVRVELRWPLPESLVGEVGPGIVVQRLERVLERRALDLPGGAHPGMHPGYRIVERRKDRPGRVTPDQFRIETQVGERHLGAIGLGRDVEGLVGGEEVPPARPAVVSRLQSHDHDQTVTELAEPEHVLVGRHPQQRVIGRAAPGEYGDGRLAGWPPYPRGTGPCDWIDRDVCSRWRQAIHTYSNQEGAQPGCAPGASRAATSGTPQLTTSGADRVSTIDRGLSTHASDLSADIRGDAVRVGDLGVVR